MGIFDELRTNGVPRPEKVNIVKDTEIEELSNLSMMDLVEKIDAFNTVFASNPTGKNFTKLEASLLELVKRIPTVPLTKRSFFNAYGPWIPQTITNIKKCLSLGDTGKDGIAQSTTWISNMCSGLAITLNV